MIGQKEWGALIEAALDQPAPTPALVKALNVVLAATRHPDAEVVA
jgi:hypothetical protein